jgi:hypothetical protein
LYHLWRIHYLQALGLTRRLSAKRSFLNNVMQQVERYGDAHAKVCPTLGPESVCPFLHDAQLCLPVYLFGLIVSVH